MASDTRLPRSLAAEDRELALELGRRLRDARLRAQLTQQAVAEPRYSKGYISALELGYAKPSLAALVWLTRRLRVRLVDLLDGIEGEMEGGPQRAATPGGRHAPPGPRPATTVPTLRR